MHLLCCLQLSRMTSLGRRLEAAGACCRPQSLPLLLLPGYSRPWPPPFSDTHASLLAYFSSVYSSCGRVYSFVHTIVHTLRSMHNGGGCFSVAPQLLLVLLIYFPSLSPASWLPCAEQLKSSLLTSPFLYTSHHFRRTLSVENGLFLVSSETFCIFCVFQLMLFRF